MIAIRKEIESATIENPNNVLKNAPHTLMVTANDWIFHTLKRVLEYVSENKFGLPSVESR
jgi:glycine dehydrogenase